MVLNLKNRKMSKIVPDESLDLRGVPCPQNSAKALIKLAGMDTGLVLELIIDDGEPYENVPESLENEGYKLIGKKKETGSVWHLFVESL